MSQSAVPTTDQSLQANTPINTKKRHMIKTSNVQKLDLRDNGKTAADALVNNNSIPSKEKTNDIKTPGVLNNSLPKTKTSKKGRTKKKKSFFTDRSDSLNASENSVDHTSNDEQIISRKPEKHAHSEPTNSVSIQEHDKGLTKSESNKKVTIESDFQLELNPSDSKQHIRIVKCDKDKKPHPSKKNKAIPQRKRNAKASVKSHVLTDYYPVRRSSRKPKSLLEKEKEDQIIESINLKCEDGLGIVDFKEKGRGVVAKRAFKKGSFIVEYAGDLIDWTEAKKREQEYEKDPSIGCYMYYFVFDNVNYCVDATAESGRLGRLLNHSRKNPNCKTTLVRFPNPEGKGTVPRLVIIAKQDIRAGEELTYDYGDKDKDTLQSHPWLKST